MISIATIGTSTITSRFAAAVAAVDGIRISHVFSRNAGRAAELAAAVDAVAAVDLDRLLTSDEIDAVYLGTPNSVHHGQALAALRAGKHVLVEKPAVPEPSEWEQLVAMATGAGLVLLEAMRTAYDPGLAAVRQLLPLLGPVRRVSLRYEKRSARYDQVLAGEQVNIFDPELAGGALMDLGVYCAHVLVSLFGEPSRVVGASVPVRSGADGAGIAIAEYAGFVADLNYSKITNSWVPSEIQGELATLVIDQIDSPRSLTLHHLDGRTEHWTVDGQRGDMTGEVGRFAHLIRTGADAGPDQLATLHALRVVAALRTAGG